MRAEKITPQAVRFNHKSLDAARATAPGAVPAIGQPPKPSQIAVAFLKRLDPGGRHNLVAIHPETKAIDGRTFQPGEWAAMAAWIEARDGRVNLYFSVNEPKPGAPHSKLSRNDIASIRAVFVDVDPSEPREGADPAAHFKAERKRLGELAGTLAASACPPSIIMDTGGGLQAFWCLAEKLDAKEWQAAAEAQGRGLADALGGDDVQDTPRIMRLPGTLNIPTARKRAKGQTVARRAGAEWLDDRYALDRIADSYAPALDKPGAGPHTDGRTEPKSRQHIVYAEIMRRRTEWVGDIVPTGLRTDTGEWRIPSRGGEYSRSALDRDLEEDLVIYRNGIFDYGTRRNHTPVSLICEFGKIDDKGHIEFGGCPYYEPGAGETFDVVGEPDPGVRRPTEQQAIAWLTRTLGSGAVEGDSLDALVRALGLCDQAMEAEVVKRAAGTWFKVLDAPTNVAPTLEPKHWQATHISVHRARLPIMRALDPDGFETLKEAWDTGCVMTPAGVDALIGEEVERVRSEPAPADDGDGSRASHPADRAESAPVDGLRVITGLVEAARLPVRRLLVAPRLPIGDVCQCVGEPGISKSTFTLRDALAIATGREDILRGSNEAGQPISPERLHRSGPVLIYNAEDRLVEMERRVAAAQRHHSVAASDMAHPIILWSGVDHGRLIIMQRIEAHGALKPAPGLASLEEVIRRHGVIFAALDPQANLVRNAVENGNEDADELFQELARLAFRTDCAVLVVHHTSKQTREAAGDMGAGRGAFAAVAKVRSAFTLTNVKGVRDGERDWNLDGKNTGLIRLDYSKLSHDRKPTDPLIFRRRAVSVGNGSGVRPETAATLFEQDPRAALEMAGDSAPVLELVDVATLKSEGGRPRNKAEAAQVAEIADSLMGEIDEMKLPELREAIGARMREAGISTAKSRQDITGNIVAALGGEGVAIQRGGQSVLIQVKKKAPGDTAPWWIMRCAQTTERAGP